MNVGVSHVGCPEKSWWDTTDTAYTSKNVENVNATAKSKFLIHRRRGGDEVEEAEQNLHRGQCDVVLANHALRHEDAHGRRRAYDVGERQSGVHAVLVPTAQKLGGGETRPESRQDERRPERAERHRLLRQNPAPPRLLVRLSARHQAAVRHLLRARSAVRPPRETRPITRANAPNSRFRANLRRAPNRGMHHSPCFPRPPSVLPPNAPPKIKPPRDASAVPCRTRASRRAPRDAGRGAAPALLG